MTNEPITVQLLAYTGCYDEAMEAADLALQHARRYDWIQAVGNVLCNRAVVLHRRGALMAAEADARAALAAVRDADSAVRPEAVAILVNILTERGELALAEDQLVTSGWGTDAPPTRIGLMLRHARGMRRLQQGRPQEALEDFLAAGELLGGNASLTVVSGWRSGAASAHLAAADREAAQRLIDRDVELARAFGEVRAVTNTLRVARLVHGGAEGLGLLHEAVRVSDGAWPLLERGRALVELGAALRRRGRRQEAKEPLVQGMDLAHRCTATALETRARQELVAAGFRPRRWAVTGKDALTAGELRVCQLAATGMKNREIAQSLFLSLRTVETHLTHAFEKLEIIDRKDLPAALAS